MSGVHRESVAVAGKNIVFEVGRLAPQASGACLVRLSDTVVLVTAVAESEPRRGIGFFPLTVEYRDRFAAAGRIPPTRIRRELRPSDTEILSSRVIDRTIRPLFPEGFRSEVQVIATVLSAEPETDPALLSLLGASAALHVSDIPWAGPVAGARFCLRGGGLVAFPEESERAGSELDLVAAIGPHGLVMVEGGAAELPEAEVIDALLGASTVLRPLIAAQERLREAVGREKRTFSLGTPPADVARAVAAYRSDLEAALTVPGKRERHQRVDAVRNDAVAAVEASLPDAPPGAAADAFGALKHELSRRLILDGRRADGRAFDEVRPIGGEAGLLPRTHGSALFTRGETQALASVTLGTGSDALAETTLFGEEKRRFLLHYNFPPYSVGETRPLRGPGRREIGHGTLAQRAIEGLLPDDETFPYTVRIVSDILASNGSSSMATVCAGCLALLDAGVPIRRPVAGIAMGLVREGDEVAVLTDILGDEDHVGDMDFKVCGTSRGVTALQMDIKMEALDEALRSRAMERARQGRLQLRGARGQAHRGDSSVAGKVAGVRLAVASGATTTTLLFEPPRLVLFGHVDELTPEVLVSVLRLAG